MAGIRLATLTKKYIVRKASKDRTFKPYVVWASDPYDACDKIKNHTIVGGLYKNDEGIWLGHHGYNAKTFAEETIEVIQIA